MNPRPSVAEWLGLARSLLIYYAIPGRAAGWRQLYRQFVSPGELCFDIGAHVGNRTAALLAIGAHVISVEPQPLMARTLDRFYGKNSRFTLIRKAIGSRTGEAQMMVSARTPTVSTLSPEWIRQMKPIRSFSKIRWDQKIRVEVIRLDDLIEEFGSPVFCKLDIEGYEFEALRGLSHPIQNISFEYLPGAKPKSAACIERLIDLGDYRFTLIQGEFPLFAIPGWREGREIGAMLQAIPANGKAGEVYARLAA